MKLATLKLKHEPEEGDYKIVKRFAWLPIKIENKLIWLERYKEIYQYKIRKRVICALQIYIYHEAVYGDWDLVTKKLIKNKGK